MKNSNIYNDVVKEGDFESLSEAVTAAFRIFADNDKRLQIAIANLEKELKEFERRLENLEVYVGIDKRVNYRDIVDESRAYEDEEEATPIIDEDMWNRLVSFYGEGTVEEMDDETLINSAKMLKKWSESGCSCPEFTAEADTLEEQEMPTRNLHCSLRRRALKNKRGIVNE